MKKGKFDDLKAGMTSDVVEHVISVREIKEFARLTGDLDPIHIDEDYAATTQYGHCIAHGVHLLGLMSDRLLSQNRYGENVSYGYNKVRFVRAAPAGTRLTTKSKIVEIRPEKSEVIIEETAMTVDGTVIAIAQHVFKFL